MRIAMVLSTAARQRAIVETGVDPEEQREVEADFAPLSREEREAVFADLSQEALGDCESYDLAAEARRRLEKRTAERERAEAVMAQRETAVQQWIRAVDACDGASARPSLPDHLLFADPSTLTEAVRRCEAEHEARVQRWLISVARPMYQAWAGQDDVSEPEWPRHPNHPSRRHHVDRDAIEDLGDLKVLIRAERQHRQELRKARAEAEEAAREAKEAERRATRIAWVEAHGSPRLRRIVAEELADNWEDLYRLERLAADRPGWTWANKNDLTDPQAEAVTDEHLDALNEARKTVADARLASYAESPGEGENDDFGYGDEVQPEPKIVLRAAYLGRTIMREV